MPLLTTGAGAYVSAAVAPSGYVGPMDVATTGAVGFFGLRAASAAVAGSVAAVQLIRSGGSGGSGSDTQDIGTDADTGELDIASTFFSGTGYTYKVVTLYNQLGTGTVGHMVPGSIPAGRPTFLRTGALDGKPVIQFSATTDLRCPVGAATVFSEPHFITALYRSEEFQILSPPIRSIVNDYNLYQIGSANNFHHYIGTSFGYVQKSGPAFHAVGIVAKGVNSPVRVDDTTTAVGTSLGNIYYGLMLSFTSDSPGDTRATECGFWNGTDHSAVLDAMVANMVAFWITGTKAGWDGSKQLGLVGNPYIYLSNENRTALNRHTAGSIRSYLLSFGPAATSQKVYVEHVVSVDGGTTDFAFGFSTAASTETNVWSTATPSTCALVTSAGTFLCADSANHNASTIASFGVGDRIGIAFDTGAGRMWFRKNNGAWNSVIGGTQDPTAGTSGGGVAIPFAGPYYAYYGIYDVFAGDGITSNFGTGDWVDAAPSGYTQLTRTT